MMLRLGRFSALKLILSLTILLIPFNVRASENKLNIYFFHSNSCTHCLSEKAFLKDISANYPNVVINSYEVTTVKDNLTLMGKVATELKTSAGGVPFLVIGDNYIVGFGNEKTTGQNIESAINEALKNNPKDIVSQVISQNPNLKPVNVVIKGVTKPIKPVDKDKAETDFSKLPLPIFTFVIALMDGFNPCSMWTLLFLISLLIGMKNRKKMILLGSTFIFVSGLVYFLFLAAWLNFFLVIGYALIVRYIVGIFAIGMGIYYLRDYYKNRGGCEVSENVKRRGIMEKIKNIVLNGNLAISMAGIAILACAVNLIELLCSAGLPALYTNVLSLNNLPIWQYYLYLIFYIFVYMLDDMIVFIGAVITFEAMGLKNKYAKYSHLVGGLIVILIGLALLFKPDLLSFK